MTRLHTCTGLDKTSFQIILHKIGHHKMTTDSGFCMQHITEPFLQMLSLNVPSIYAYQSTERTDNQALKTYLNDRFYIFG